MVFFVVGVKHCLVLSSQLLIAQYFWGQRLVFSIMQVSLYGALYVGHLLNRWGDLFVLKMIHECT